MHFAPARHKAKSLQVCVAARVLGKTVLKLHAFTQPVAWLFQIGVAKHQVLFGHLEQSGAAQARVRPKCAGQNLGFQIDRAGVVYPCPQHARQAVHTDWHLIPLSINQVALKIIKNFAPIQYRLGLSEGENLHRPWLILCCHIRHLVNLQSHATAQQSTTHGGRFQWLVV